MRGSMERLVLCTCLLAAVARADWRTDANARIRKYRMFGATIEVTSLTGTPLSQAQVTIAQQRHDFRFGTAIANGVTGNAGYWNIVKNNFNFAVCENAMKWAHGDPAEAKRIFDKCASYGIPLRGHCLFWGRGGELVGDPSDLTKLSSTDLRNRMKTRVSGAITPYKGKIREWDFSNEMICNRYPPDPNATYAPEDFYTKKLGPGIVNEIMGWAHALDPEMRLTFNEFGIAGEKMKAPLYYDMVRYYLSREVPRATIGINLQAHMSDNGNIGENVHADTLWKNLEILAAHNLPLQLTEFDYDNPDENKRAVGLETVYRTMFSHPLAVGIVMWGFWDQKHWKPAAALWKGSGFSETAAARMYRRLVFTEWWTNETVSTAVNGTAAFTAFHGTHRITVVQGGKTGTFTLTCKQGSAPVLDKSADANFRIRVTSSTATEVVSRYKGPEPSIARQVETRGYVSAIRLVRPDGRLVAGTSRSPVAGTYVVIPPSYDGAQPRKLLHSW